MKRNNLGKVIFGFFLTLFLITNATTINGTFTLTTTTNEENSSYVSLDSATNELIETLSSETIEIPSSETIEAPSSETVEAPSSETVEAPSSETVEAPSSETVEAPMSETSNTPPPPQITIPLQQADVPPYLEVHTSISPSTPIYLEGTEIPDTATVTLEVSGHGDPISGRVPLDVIFSIDSSGSMRRNDPSNLRLEASKIFVDHMDNTIDYAGLVSWHYQVEFTEPLTQNFEYLKNRIDQVGNSGSSTNLNLGISEAIDLLDQGAHAGTARVIIFLTDGVGTYTPSTNPNSPTAEAANKGYVIYAIGLGTSINPSNLQDMATATGGEYFLAQTAGDLIPIFNTIAQQVSNIAGTDIEITEILADHINYVPGSASITPMISSNILQWDVPLLNIDDTWQVTFDITADECGILPVALYPDSEVEFTNYLGAQETLVIPELFVEVISPNSPPEADADGPYISDEGTFIFFDASGSVDPDGDMLQYRWDFENDGIWDTPYTTDPSTIAAFYKDDYVGTVMVEVFDGEFTDTAVSTILINNVAPTAMIDEIGPVLMLDSLEITGTAYDQGSDDLIFTWNFGDGTPEVVNLYINNMYPVEIQDTINHIYTKPGIYNITLTVEDDDGGIAGALFRITVLGPQDLKKVAISELETLKTGCKCFDHEIDFIIKKIECSLNDKLWEDEIHLNPKCGHLVFIYEKLATCVMEAKIWCYTKMIPKIEKLIEYYESKGYDPTCLKKKLEYMKNAILVFESAILSLVKADELIAKIALNEAENTPVQNPKFQKKVDWMLEKANLYFVKANELVEQGDYSKAIWYYKISWEYSQSAIKWANKNCCYCYCKK